MAGLKIQEVVIFSFCDISLLGPRILLSISESTERITIPHASLSIVNVKNVTF